MKYIINLENSLTGETFEVARFAAMGDATLAVNYFNSITDKNFVYSMKKFVRGKK